MPLPPLMWNMRSCVPPVARIDAITYCESGVQVGEMTASCVSFDSFRGSLPSIFEIHRLSLPLRSLMNAIHFPSGEMRGCAS